MVRVACLAAGLIAAGFLLLPGRPASTETLRQDYLDALRGYTSAVYVWGGETRAGIDCSGLVRRGLIDANLARGLRSANPALVRQGLSLWLNDCSAKALGEEYRGWTQAVLNTSSLNDADYDKLLPGDVAVTSNGVHTLAYLGDRTWIEADPGAWRVIQVTVPTPNAWFSQPMRVVRWRQLTAP